MTLKQGQHLHVDCASGAAGDMLVGAFLDLGVPLEAIGSALDAIDRIGRARLGVTRVVKRGMAAVAVHVADHGDPRHGEREPHSHAHHHYADIRARIAAAPLTEGTRRRALDTFDRLASAEAKLHGTSVERVAFHEVGAIDSIFDIVAAAAALDYLAPESVSCSTVAMGHGSLVSAHGIMPVPAPAALEVLRACGGVMSDGGVARELCTPTGAAILAAAVTQWTPAPTGRAIAVGWGAGDMELDDRANVVRIVLMARASQPGSDGDAIWQIDANLDDMNPELCAHAADAIFGAGAVDVWWTPIGMKKGRPGLLLSALVADPHREEVIGAILRETTTIGVRFAVRERRVLSRGTVDVTTRFGAIAVKEAREGARVVNAAPEYESCSEAAKRAGVPLKEVYAAALAAYEAARSRP